MKACIFLSLLTVLFFCSNGILARLGIKHNKVVTCYVASWAVYRNNDGKFGIPYIRPELCTHIIYAFAGLDSKTWTITSLDPNIDIDKDNYKRMTELREQYPGLNILLAIGGWNEGSKNYSILASSPTRRSIFVKSVVDFLEEYKFDGFDLDWEYPGSRGGSPEDKLYFALLVKQLKEAFKESNYLLTAALGSNKAIIDTAYDIPEISKYLDYIHVMAYDYHGSWDKKVLPNAPLRSGDGLSVMETLNYLLSKGAPANKTILGLPMYGRTYILASKLNSSQESPINRTTITNGFKGPYTDQEGFMGYNEICEELVSHKGNWTSGWDDTSDTPYVINDDHVIVYDNLRSLKAKIEYAMSLELAGVMIWSIDTDDFHGKCANLFKDSLNLTDMTYPLLRWINIVVSENSQVISDKDSVNMGKEYNDNSSSITKFSHNSILIILISLAYYI
ncbi:probable chitinase 2 isoform X1 [Bombus impatiens]|uniref:Probable chitinase 2 isoform X1 n=2 Tax=Bombus impatiens TaxID=132113 RepID=A0A6P3DQZ5_BOMIM|nr:probable chitinase 2 isoform X1 [Bombus impatiens]